MRIMCYAFSMGRPKGNINKKHKPQTTSICKQCGKAIIHYPSITRSFCSKICKATYQETHLLGRNNPNWKEDKFYYSNPHSLQKLIKRRDIYCQKCGSPSNLEVHHKDGNHFNNNDGNLTLLCKNCHAQEHLQNGQPEVVSLILSTRKYHRRPSRNCPICGKEFTPRDNRIRCCSRQCAAKLSGLSQKGRIPPNKGINRVALTCHTCGKQFERRQGNIKSKLAFCSRSCQIDYFSHCHA